MKIVHALPHLGRGGGERLTIELANRQVRAGHQVTLLVGHQLPAEQMHGGLDDRVNVRFIIDAPAKRVTKYLQILPWLLRHRDFIAEHDVVHCHLTFGAVLGTLVHRLLGDRRRPAIVETYHAVGMPIPRLQRWFHARLASQWDGLSFMVEDPYWRAFMREHPEIVSRVIPVGVADPQINQVSDAQRTAYKESLGIPPERGLVVGTVGRLYAERRPRRYVPVFAGIAETLGRDVHFLMGGHGPERAAIEADAATCGMSQQLHMAGLVTEIALPLAVTDLYITATVGPAPGVAGLQAVAAGVPVIGIQLSEHYAASEGDWIWSSRDPAEVAAVAADLLRSPEQRRELADRQRKHLQANHSAQAMAENIQLLYRDALQRSRFRRSG